MREENENRHVPVWNRLSIVLIVFFLFGCGHSGSRAPVSSGPEGASIHIRRVALMPFENMAALYGDGASFRCPLCQRTYLIGEVASGSEALLTDTLFRLLEGRNGLAVIPPDRVREVRSTFQFNEKNEITDIEGLMKTGRFFNVDAVLLGRVFKYKDREGTAFSARSPASVSIDLVLVAVSDGRVIWDAHFSETQQSLSENLLNAGSFFKRGMQWVTAEKLAVSGMEKILASFPGP